MERTLKILFFIGLFFYFLYALAARAPAELAVKAVLDNSRGLTIGGVSGTVWKGKASSAQLLYDGELIDFGRVNWELEASALLAMKACATVETALFDKARFCRSPSGYNRIQELIIDDIPANMFNRWIGIASVDGNINLVIRNALVNDKGNVKAMDANLAWQGARIDAGAGWFDLGAYSADLSENGAGGVRALVTDLSGGYGLNAEGEYTVGSEPSVRASITPREGANQMVVDSLGLIAQPEDDGSFIVTWPM